MESNISKVRLHKEGLIANDIHLVIKKWIISPKDIELIISDTTTVFASLSNVVGSKDTTQCRKLLGIQDNIDLAMIFIITLCNTKFIDKQVVTNWIGSDLQDSSVKIVIRGELSPELKGAGIGSVCAILNPNIKEQVIASDLKSITIKQLDDILVIGQLDGLNACKGITSKGEMCKNLVYVHNQGDYCKYHIKFANKKNNTRINKTGNNINKMANGTSNKVDMDQKILEARLGERTYVEQTKPFTLMERPKPAKQSETIAKLGDLNFLMQKIINNRTSPTISAASTTISTASNAASSNTQPKINGIVNQKAAKPHPSVESGREFETLTNLIKQYASKDSKEYNNLLGTIQITLRKVNGVSSDAIKRTQIMKLCDILLDHPMENIAISALKLRRAVRKCLKGSNKEGEYTVTRLNTGIVNDKSEQGTKLNGLTKADDLGDNKLKKLINNGNTKETILNDLDRLINLTSNVESIVDKEKGTQLKEKLKQIEKMDKTEDFKLTIKYIEVEAYHCRECDMWFEYINNYCKREKHSLTKKKVKKEYHICINKPCNYRYYSLNGQKPSRCPKCKQTTVVSEKTSFYKPRPNYLMPNETLMESEVGGSRPLNCDS